MLTRIITAIFLVGVVQSGQASSGASDFAEVFVNYAVDVGKNQTYGDQKTDEAVFNASLDAVVGQLTKHLAEKIISSGVESGALKVSAKEMANAMYFRAQNIYSTRISAIKGASATIITDVVVGIVVDVASDELRNIYGKGTLQGEYAAYAMQQTKVAWAASRNGMHGAIVAQAMISGKQVTEVAKLHVELSKQLKKASTSAKISNALESVAHLRTQYKQAGGLKAKNKIELEIREEMKKDLVTYGLFGKEKPLAGSAEYVENYISTLKDADKNKVVVAAGLRKRISDNPENAHAYAEAAKSFVSKNFEQPYKVGKGLEWPAGKQRKLIEEEFASVSKKNATALNALYEKASAGGGLSSLTAKEIDSVKALAVGLTGQYRDLPAKSVANYFFKDQEKFTNYISEFGIEPSKKISDANENPTSEGSVEVFVGLVEDNSSIPESVSEQTEIEQDAVDVDDLIASADSLLEVNRKKAKAYEALYKQFLASPQDKALAKKVNAADAELRQSTVAFIEARGKVLDQNSAYSKAASV